MNIYNNSGATFSNEPGNLENLSVKNLTAENAEIDNLNVDMSAVFTGGIQTNSLNITNLNNGDLLFKQSNAIDGLSIGPNNNILNSNGSAPFWSNNATLNKIITNELEIINTNPGDLLVGGPNFQRLPIGSSGFFLQSDGVNPSWSPIPNPFIVGNLIVDGSLQLTNYIDGPLMTVGNTVSAERNQIKIFNASFSTTLTQYYGSVEWNLLPNRHYLLTVIQNFDFPEVFDGKCKKDNILLFDFFKTQNNNQLTNKYYFFNLSSTLVGFSLEARAGSGTSNVNVQIILEPFANPVVH